MVRNTYLFYRSQTTFIIDKVKANQTLHLNTWETIYIIHSKDKIKISWHSELILKFHFKNVRKRNIKAHSFKISIIRKYYSILNVKPSTRRSTEL